jgi:xanthine dehydrogenase YagR molybdenum-binding subunit
MADTDTDTVSTSVGQALNRVDGPLKVCGRAPYAAEFTLPRLVHATLVLSTVPRGRVSHIDVTGARRMPGVLDVLTHLNAPQLPEGGKAALQPPAGRVMALLQDDRIHHNGQPIAVVIADTLERSQEAAMRLVVQQEAATPTLDFAAAKAIAQAPARPVQGDKADTERGSVADGLRQASQQLAQTYRTPIEHHNPLEPHATLAAWDGDRLTLWDSTQYVTGVKTTVAKTLGIAPEQVQVLSPYVGGGFGCKGSTWSHVVLAAMAARLVGRPVRLVLQRPQMFSLVGHRPQTEQALLLAADAEGRLTATRHATTSETSQIEEWVEPSAILTRMLYAGDNLATAHRLAKLDIPTPTFMRAPGEASGSFALESALDELAWQLGVDPIELRLRNHTDQDLNKQLPFSSKSLRACYAAGAERFGWARRGQHAPGSLRDGPWQVGCGMATATYPTHRMPAQALARYLADGSALVQSGSQDLGTGTYTVMTQVAADALGLAPQQVRFELGDSRMPPAPVSGGSMTAASVGSAVHVACEAARDKLLELALADAQSPLYRAGREQVSVQRGWLVVTSDAARREPIAALLARQGGQPVQAQAESQPGAEGQQYAMHSFGAVFVEVHVDADLGQIRVPRVVGAYGVGRLLNEKTGRSQLMGGIVWGLGMALFEESWRDPRNGRIVNGNLAEYHLPTNADVGEIDVIVVPEHDPHINPLGAKGIGEIGITGVAAAVANAVYHATGRRVRELPITLDKLL